jgi:hypothetical protein
MVSCFYDNVGWYDGPLAFGIRQGKGTMDYINGDKYDGEWNHNLMHGQGTYTQKGGCVKSGTWIEGKFTGVGSWEFPDGIYEGSFLDDKKHGKGTLNMFNGTIMTGLWCQDHHVRWVNPAITKYFPEVKNEEDVFRIVAETRHEPLVLGRGIDSV